MMKKNIKTQEATIDDSETNSKVSTAFRNQSICIMLSKYSSILIVHFYIACVYIVLIDRI